MRKHLAKGVYCLILLPLMVSCVDQEAETDITEMEITYDYGGKGNSFLHLAGSAAARSGGRLLGEATLLNIQSEPGSDGMQHASLLDVEETHFTPSGAVLYRGKICYSVPLGSKVKEERIEGTKTVEIFGSWPAGM